MDNFRIPEGCLFSSRVMPICFEAGDYLPDDYRFKKGDCLVNEDYKYIYLGQDANGWGLSVNETSKNKKEFDAIFSKIGDVPVTDMSFAFQGCRNMVKAPEIPENMKEMTGAFLDCARLEKAPEIPDGVKGMSFAFSGCSSLTELPKIPDSVKTREEIFAGAGSGYSIADEVLNENTINLYTDGHEPSAIERSYGIDTNIRESSMAVDEDSEYIAFETDDYDR